MPKHEMLTDEELGGLLAVWSGDIGFDKVVARAQHAKTLAWADARKVRCPCVCHRSDPRLCATTDTEASVPSLCVCHGDGRVSWGDLVKEAGV